MLEASPVNLFDERSKGMIPEAERALWDQFLAETADLNKIGVDELKAQYKDEVDKMAGVFNNYKKKKVTRKEESPKTKPPEEKKPEEEKGAQKEFIPPEESAGLFQGKVK